MAASLVFTALLTVAGSASAALTITPANQTGTLNTYPFTPTWTPAAGSLIAGLTPSAMSGNFALDDTNRNVNSLTSGGSLAIGTTPGNTGPDPIGNTTTSSNYVTCGNGSGAGSLIVYTLPASANGYNLTNITVYSGWADAGRDGQAYTVLYSTVANPTSFNYLTSAGYNPSGIPNGTPTANRVIINDSTGGVIAANVAAIEFVFSVPTVENGYAGYGAITVQGTPAASVVSPVISITTSNQSSPTAFTPTWPVESPSLIAGLAPTTAPGTFTQEGAAGTTVLTDGIIGQSGDVSFFATCGSAGGTTLIYTLTNVVNGSDLTNIVLYSGWGNADRDGQYFIVSYSTIAAPTTYTPITTVLYNPTGVVGASANRVSIAMSNGSSLATGVANLKFDFATLPSASSFDNGYSGYSEIIVQGKDSTTPPPPPSPLLTQDTLPSYAETVVGDQVIFTAAYSNAPPASLQWVFISSGTTNTIAGANGTTLTLNNVQLANAGSYALKAVNATNGVAAPSYSTAAPLVVSNSPTAVNNVIVNFAGQSGLGGAGTSPNFYPTWNIDTNNDLILGFPTDGSGNPGTATAGLGNYGLDSTSGDPTILADGTFGYINSTPLSGGNPTLVSCGTGGASPGLSMTYTLNTGSAPSGYDLTNIVIYGGWPDAGRNEQKYQVLYSTVAAPNSFNSMGTFDYNPNDPNNVQSATRVTLVPAAGVLAANVAALQINWNLQGSPPKNGWEGYSEIIVKGTPSAPKPVLTQSINPLTAQDVVGSTLVLNAGFSGATSYQWQKNTVDIPGATSPTLTLSNLQPTDTATNGGYRLTASNGAGTSVTRGCAVIVSAAPTAVGNVTTAFAFQTSDVGSFTPTWDTSSFGGSLISGASPTSFGTGNFNDPDGTPTSFNLAGGWPVLTDSDYGAIIDGGAHPAFATGGNNAGQFVTYTLPANVNGYNITNIVIASGWNDSGRDADWATISYSTVANPGTFIPIAVVTNNPPVTMKSVIRATIIPVAGLIASNIYAINVDFTRPVGIPNGYSGFSQINIFGSPSATLPTPPAAGAARNPSFELDVTAPGTSSRIVPISWTAFNAAGGADIGSENAGGADFMVNNPLAAPAAGNQFVFINMFDPNVTGGIYQDVGALQPNTPYTLTVAIGSRNDRINSPGIISLVNGTDNTGTVLATGGGLPATQNTWQDYTVSFTTGASVSGDLTIVLSVLGDATTIQADFDNVRVATAPAAPTVAVPKVSGGNLILTGTGGTPNGGYAFVTTTNLTTPLINWTVSTTGVFDGTGAFSNAIPINTSKPTSFFRLRTP